MAARGLLVVMGGLTLALICVAATGLLVVICERHE